MLSIIIPTLNKAPLVLDKLLYELNDDSCVDEIIVIDNSAKGLKFPYSKVKTINLEENIFVNPAWNLGVKEAKNEFIGVLNDDLILPLNFCSQVLDFIKKDDFKGMVGLGCAKLVKSGEFTKYPKNSKLKFKKIKNLARDICLGWGSAYFCKKKDYHFIPEEIKIYCGDNYLWNSTLNNKGDLYKIEGASVYHLHRASSGAKEFNSLLDKDQKIYASIEPSYIEFCALRNKPKFLQRIFSVRNEGNNKILYILGVRIDLGIRKQGKK